MSIIRFKLWHGRISSRHDVLIKTKFSFNVVVVVDVHLVCEGDGKRKVGREYFIFEGKYSILKKKKFVGCLKSDKPTADFFL